MEGLLFLLGLVLLILLGLVGLFLLAGMIIHSIVSAHQNAPSRARLSDNDAWEGGSKQQVTWRFTGAVPRVKIRLQSVSKWNFSNMFGFFETRTWFPPIEYDIKNHGLHVVTVPTGLVPGKYYLTITSTSDDRISATSPIFTIDKMATPPEINDVAFPRCLVAVGRLQTWLET